VINYFEYYYRPHGSDLDFRPEFRSQELDFLRSRARNAMILLDLITCRAAVSPTDNQRGLFHEELRHKIEIIFDGIETDVFHHRSGVSRRVGGRDLTESAGSSLTSAAVSNRCAGLISS
jgi:hypothetical protein